MHRRGVPRPHGVPVLVSVRVPSPLCRKMHARDTVAMLWQPADCFIALLTGQALLFAGLVALVSCLNSVKFGCRWASWPRGLVASCVPHFAPVRAVDGSVAAPQQAAGSRDGPFCLALCAAPTHSAAPHAQRPPAHSARAPRSAHAPHGRLSHQRSFYLHPVCSSSEIDWQRPRDT